MYRGVGDSCQNNFGLYLFIVCRLLVQCSRKLMHFIMLLISAYLLADLILWALTAFWGFFPFNRKNLDGIGMHAYGS